MAVPAAVVATAVVVVVAVNLLCFAAHERSPLHCRGWPRLLWISNSALYADPATPVDYLALSRLDPAHLTSSLFLPPWALLLLRAGGVAYVAATLAVIAAHRDWGPRPWLVFFTNWTFCLLGVWAVLGTGLSARAVWRGGRTRRPRVRPSDPGSGASGAVPTSPASPSSPDALMGASASVRRSDVDSPPVRGAAAGDAPPLTSTSWPPFDAFFLILTAVITPASIFLSAFFWGVLYPHVAASTGGAPPPAHMVLEHGGNVVLLLADAVLSRTPVVSYHFQFVILYGSAYVVFMWIWHGATRGDWIYGSFDWHRPWAAGAYAVLPFLLAAAFAAWYGVAAGREAAGRALERRRRARRERGGVSPPPPLTEMVTPPRVPRGGQV